jgi:hypothetical protein
LGLPIEGAPAAEAPNEQVVFPAGGKLAPPGTKPEQVEASLIESWNGGCPGIHQFRGMNRQAGPVVNGQVDAKIL